MNGANTTTAIADDQADPRRLQPDGGNGKRDQAGKGMAYHRRICRTIGAGIKNGVHVLRPGEVRSRQAKRIRPMGDPQIRTIEILINPLTI